MTGPHPSAANDGGNLATVTRRQVFTADAAYRIAAMLGLPEAPWPDGACVPCGWHFALFGSEPTRRLQRADGFAGLGVPFPDVAGKRLVAAGRKVMASRELRIGQAVQRTSRVASITTKVTGQGPLTIVKVEHVISDLSDGGLILSEEQTYMVVAAPYGAPGNEPAPPGKAAVIKTVTPNETMLFQFSALSFNSHKIHLDRNYARMMEGYPDLVVNGGLTTLLMTEIVRAEPGGAISRLTVRNAVPLFASRPIRFARETLAGQNRILAFDDTGRLAAEMEYDRDDF